MGAPSSGILSEIFLQYIQALHIAHLTKKNMIINYFHYVDDILLIFDFNHTNIQAILTDFNSIDPNLHFITETEQNNTINYLDISIQKTAHNIRIAITEKPTFTDTIITYSANHPTQHKYAAIRYLYNRLHIPIKKEECIQEKNVIRNILNNNSFPIQPRKIPKPKQNQTINSQIEIPKQKWATFTYIGKETTYIIKIFKYTQI